MTENEAVFWKNLAMYLADCHTATAEYDGLLKSCSGSRRKRFASICQKAAKAMRSRSFAPVHGNQVENVINRCEEAVRSLQKRNCTTCGWVYPQTNECEHDGDCPHYEQWKPKED